MRLRGYADKQYHTPMYCNTNSHELQVLFSIFFLEIQTIYSSPANFFYGYFPYGFSVRFLVKMQQMCYNIIIKLHYTGNSSTIFIRNGAVFPDGGYI